MFFSLDEKNVPLVPVRDSSPNEFRVLKNPVWCGFSIMAVVIFGDFRASTLHKERPDTPVQR